jgi:TetR/AcrR family transcriptional regulator, transcriptional repressor for nem operon
MRQEIKQSLSEEILDKAMNLFWEKGFGNTSINDIINTTGLNRATLYKTFGGKNKFFLATLEHFYQTVTYKVTRPLRNQADGINGIIEFFSQFIELYDSAGLCSRGCFIIATASDINSHDEHVVYFIEEFIVGIRTSFRNLLTQSRTDKLLKVDIDIDLMTDFLVGNLFGLLTLCRASVPKEVYDNHIHGITYFLSTLTTN